LWCCCSLIQHHHLKDCLSDHSHLKSSLWKLELVELLTCILAQQNIALRSQPKILVAKSKHRNVPSVYAKQLSSLSQSKVARFFVNPSLLSSSPSESEAVTVQAEPPIILQDDCCSNERQVWTQETLFRIVNHMSHLRSRLRSRLRSHLGFLSHQNHQTHHPMIRQRKIHQLKARKLQWNLCRKQLN